MRLVSLASALGLMACGTTSAAPVPHSAARPATVVTTPAPSTPEPVPRAAAPSAASPSAAAPRTSAAAQESYQDGWRALLVALRSGEVERVKARTTEAGYGSLMTGVGSDDPAVTFRRWGKGWAAWAVRWQAVTDSVADANVGPEVKEHGIRLVKDGRSWKLDRWTPGD